ncbi:MAG: hypothetical protein AB7N91_06450 [Candidatus Tectimicrobiota bacterium]
MQRHAVYLALLLGLCPVAAGDVPSLPFTRVACSTEAQAFWHASAAIDSKRIAWRPPDTAWDTRPEAMPDRIETPGTREAHRQAADHGVRHAQFTLPDSPPRPERYNVLEHGLKGDCLTPDGAALQSLVDAMPAGSTLYFPPTRSGCYLFAQTRINIPKEVTIKCQSWETVLKWDMEQAPAQGCPDTLRCNLGGLNIYHPAVTDGIYLSQVHVEGCHFQFGGARGQSIGHGTLGWKRGINIYQANDVYVAYNWVDQVTGEGIGVGNFGSATKGNRSWLLHNYVSNFAQVGINPNNSNNLVHGNRFETGTLAIEMGGRNTIATRNTAVDLTDQMFAIQTTQAVVADNVCRTCYTKNPASTDGIIVVSDRGSCFGTTHLIIRGNMLLNTSAGAQVGGIVVFNSAPACPPRRNAQITIEGNVIGLAIPTGIYIEQCDSCTIAYNDVQGATTALAIANRAGTVRWTAIHGNRLHGQTPLQDQSSPADGNRIGWNDLRPSSRPLPTQ